jgi:hypothetical protein
MDMNKIKLKHVELKEETRMQLNMAKSILIQNDPSIKKLTDDYVIRLVLIDFLQRR